MSLPAHHFHGSVTVILSKTAQKPVDKKRPLQLQMEKSEERQKKERDCLRRRRPFSPSSTHHIRVKASEDDAEVE